MSDFKRILLCYSLVEVDYLGSNFGLQWHMFEVPPGPPDGGNPQEYQMVDLAFIAAWQSLAQAQLSCCHWAQIDVSKSRLISPDPSFNPNLRQFCSSIFALPHPAVDSV